jgi:hypothetical protein
MRDEELKLLDRDRNAGLSRWCDQYLAAEYLRLEALRLMPLAQGELSKKQREFAEMVTVARGIQKVSAEGEKLGTARGQSSQRGQTQV